MPKHNCQHVKTKEYGKNDLPLCTEVVEVVVVEVVVVVFTVTPAGAVVVFWLPPLVAFWEPGR